MSKVKQLFEIDEYTLWDKEIEVFLMNDTQEKEINIPREKFEQWLEDSGRLNYCNDSVNYAGDHIQETGTISIDHYWDNIFIDKKPDLYDYILLKVVDAKKIFDIESPLKRILENAFSHLMPQS